MSQPQPTPIVDLAAINPLTEIVLRGGDTKHPNARATLQRTYTAIDSRYPDAIGISTLFRVGATLDELMREGRFRHPKVGYARVERIMSELAAAGYQLVLFVTPDPAQGLPDHHSLAVAIAGVVQPTLSDAAADALLHALTVRDNPYQSKP